MAVRFRWVVCQMDYLCELPHDAARRKALNALPPTLHATYERILQRINKCNKDVQQLVQRSLRWLVCSKAHLSSVALCEAISIETGDNDLDRNRISDENEVLRWCSSLVRRSALGDSLELAHFTVKEFLMTGIDPRDEEFGLYCFGLEADGAELAEKCLTYLSFQECTSEKIIERRKALQNDEACSLRQYAVRYWPDHARKNLSKPVVMSLVRELLHPLKLNTFMSWAQDLSLIVDGQFHRDAEHSDLRTATPLHFASMLFLPECCEWLLQEGCYINQSSALGTPLECALLGDIALKDQALARMLTKSVPAELENPRQATVKLLIGSGADVHRSSFKQLSPMNITLRMGDKVSCIELLRNGAPIDSGTAEELSKSYNHDFAREIWQEMDTASLRPKDLATLLDAALSSESFSQEHTPRVLAHESLDMLRPFLKAAEYGQLGIVKKIAQGQFNINAEGDQGRRSALHLAASNDHLDIVKFLVEHGADRTLIDSQGRTPLHAAVENASDCRCLHLLFDSNVDANLGDKEGLTAWHLAALAGNIHALRSFRDFTANGQSQSHLKANDGRTLLHCAAQSASKDSLVFLIDHCNQTATHQTTSEGFTALHYAVKRGSLDAVQFLIDRDFDVHAKTNDGSNTLHCAVDQDGDFFGEIFDTDDTDEIGEIGKVVELLLQRGVDPCESRKDGLTPINLLLSEISQRRHNYATTKFDTTLRVFTTYATSLDITCGPGLNPLHQVCQLRKTEITDYRRGSWRPNALKILLQSGVDPTVQDNMGKTALLYLVEAWKERFRTLSKRYSMDFVVVDMIKELLNSINYERYLSNVCADPQILCIALISHNEELAYKVLEHCTAVDAPIYDISGSSCFEAACKYGCSRRLLEELLGRSKVDPGIARSKSGLLTLACTRTAKRSSYKKTAIDLLDLGFDPNDRTMDGKSALMFAAEAGNLAVVEILIDHGADVSATDKYGWSVIHYALLSRDKKLWHFLLHFKTDWNAMIAMEFSGCWNRDATALHLAASLHNGALDFLLTNNLVADINHVTNLQTTALFVAIIYGSSRNVDLLLEANADATISDRGTCPPLHFAASCGNMEIVTVFASKGTNLLLQDNLGFTPELVARKTGHLDVAKFLQEKTKAEDGGKPLPRDHIRIFLIDDYFQEIVMQPAKRNRGFLSSHSTWPLNLRTQDSVEIFLRKMSMSTVASYITSAIHGSSGEEA